MNNQILWNISQLLKLLWDHKEKKLKKCYKNSSVKRKQKLLSSIFPENLFFEGDKCRTTRINDVLRFILQIDNKLNDKKRGQFTTKLKLSSRVESEGIEPSSKQVTKELSTRLFYSWILDCKLTKDNLLTT